MCLARYSPRASVRINPGKTETNKLMKTKKRRLDAEETRFCCSFVCVNWTGKSKCELDIVLVSDWGCSWICSLARPPVTKFKINEKTAKEPEGIKTKTTGGEETLPLWISCVRSWSNAKTARELCLAEVRLEQVDCWLSRFGWYLSHKASPLSTVTYRHCWRLKATW